MSASLQQAISEANQKAGVARQKSWGKKSFVKTTELQLIDNLCERIDEALTAHFKGTGDVGVAMKNLQSAVAVTRKRVESLVK